MKLTKEDQDLIKKIFDEEGIAYHPGTMFQDTGQLSGALMKGFGKRATEYATDDNLAYSMMEINLMRFGYNKNIAEITELNQALRASENFNDFKAQATDIISTFRVHHLRTEYDTAVATGQNAARYFNQVSEAGIFPYLQYQTAGDDKVREEHASLDGKVFSIRDPDLDAIYPPNGFNCRCEMIQIDSDEGAAIGITSGSEGKGLLGDEWDAMQKNGFDVNKAVAGEVFDLNKIYASQLEGAGAKDLYDLDFTDIGLNDAHGLQAALKHGKMPLDDLSQDSILKAFDKKAVMVGDKKMNILEDYAGRPIGLQRETVAGQTSGSYLSPGEKRNAIYTNLKQVLNSPDEVWMTPETGDAYRYRYIRYYKDDLMMTDVMIDRENGRRIVGWTRNMGSEKQARKGLLIYGSE